MGIFREYDIRGIVEPDLTPDVVERIGRSYATLARERGVRTITVGRDGRLSFRNTSKLSCCRTDRFRDKCCRSWPVRDPLVVFLTVFL